MKENDVEPEQVPVEGIIIAHELLESGTRLVIVVEGIMDNVPRKVKIIW